MPEHLNFCHARTPEFLSCQNTWISVMPEHLNFCHARTPEFLSCQNTWISVMPEHLNFCHARTPEFLSCQNTWIFGIQLSLKQMFSLSQWLEHRTRDWKVAGSNPCWNGGRIFFSRVDFLCWLLFRYPFHPRVTTVARKKSRSFCQKCRWQVTAKHAYTLRMWILLNRASALVTTCP